MNSCGSLHLRRSRRRAMTSRFQRFSISRMMAFDLLPIAEVFMERVFKATGWLLGCCVFLAAAGTASFGQAPAAAADDSKPSSLNNVSQDYPKVDSQMRVHFRVPAPNAQKVQIQFSNPLDPQ